MVLGAYGGFAPEMAGIARQFFERQWIDAPVRVGKAQGAFSAATVPSVHPYVLMNYQGKVRDVMTLAHELGTVCTSGSRATRARCSRRRR